MVGKAGEGQGANSVFGQPSSNQLTHGTLQKRDQMVNVSWESNSGPYKLVNFLLSQLM